VNLNDPNIPLLESVVSALGALQEKFVFVGGCATGLLVTDTAAAPVRATTDVDAIVEVVTLAEYHALERELQRAGFQHDRRPEAPVCRWVVAHCQLDIMPADERVLGFGNRWFDEAIRTAELTQLPGGHSIRLVTSPLFLATKLEAFRTRGRGDFLGSHDLEDILAVVDGRPELLGDVRAAAPAVSAYIMNEIGSLLQITSFIEALPGHVASDEASQARVPMIRERLRYLAGES
jgi:predicted nucleotidyltransferase